MRNVELSLKQKRYSSNLTILYIIYDMTRGNSEKLVSERYGFSVTEYVKSVIWTWRKDYHVTNRTKLAKTRYEKDGTLTYLPPTNTMLREQEIDLEYPEERGKWKLYAIDMTIGNPKLYNQYFEHYLEDGISGKAQILSDDEITRIVDDSEE